MRGSEAKEYIAKKILETFPDSFTYNNGKEIRIPYMEGSELIQVKCVLTAAKVNVGAGADIAVPGAAVQSMQIAETATPAEITPEEKKNVENLIEALGL